MDTELLKTVSKVAGIGGIALCVLLFVFRDVIRKNIFPMLTKDHAYRIIRLIIISTFLIAVIGIVAWVYVNKHEDQRAGDDPPLSGGNKPISSKKRKLDKPPDENDPRPPSPKSEDSP